MNYDLWVGEKRPEEAADAALSELNAYLADGWRVICMSPTSGTGTSKATNCLVIIEKK